MAIGVTRGRNTKEFETLNFVAGVLVAGMVYMFIFRLRNPQSNVRVRTIELSNMATAYVAAAFLWPFVWHPLVGQTMLSHSKWTIVGFVWPLIILTVDLIWVTRHPLELDDTKRGSFTFDGNAISGLSFALGGLLLSQVGAVFAKSAAPLISACIFLVIAFVIPNPGVHVRSGLGAVLLSSKKIAMAFCVGLLISAIAVSLQIGLRNRKVLTKEMIQADSASQSAHSLQTQVPPVVGTAHSAAK